jgi:hypothetical protein
VEGHEFQVILMSSDPEMRRSGDRRILGETVGDEEIVRAGGRAHEASDFSDNDQKSQTAEIIRSETGFAIAAAIGDGVALIALIALDEDSGVDWDPLV